MFKKLHLFFFLILLTFLSVFSPVQAYLNGGYVSGSTPGDCFLTFSTFTVASNTVNVDTIRAELVFSNRAVVSTNLVNVPVSVSITNTGVNPATFTLGLNFFNTSIGNVATGFTFVPSSFINPVILPAGTSATYSFLVNFPGPLVPTFPVIVDVSASAVTPLGNDRWWTAIDGTQVSAAVTPLIWSTLLEPIPTAVSINPQYSQGFNPTTLRVTFNMDMNDAVAPVFEAINVATALLQGTFTGNWTSASPTVNWTGTIDTTAWPEGDYRVSGSGAVAQAGITMNSNAANSDLIRFVIDRSAPDANLYHAVTGNPGIPFAVTLVASGNDILIATPLLSAVFTLTDNTTITVPVVFGPSFLGQGITWSGTVTVPLGATPNSVATFNNYFATNNVGVTSSVIASGSTFNIGLAIPFITNLTFDGAPIVNGDFIGPTPLIRFWIVDAGSSGGISANSVYILLDGNTLVSGGVLTLVGPGVYEFSYQVLTPLNIGNHFFEFGASDLSDAPAIPVQLNVRITDRPVDLVRSPFNGPNPFSPNGDGVDDVTYIVYELNRPAEVRIYIFNMDGEVIWRKDIDEGQEGAHAGYNSVLWDGLTSLGDELPNGVYIGHIIVRDRGDNKSLGRVRIVILK